MGDIWERVILFAVADAEQGIRSRLEKLRVSDPFLAMGSEIERAMAAAFVLSLHGSDIHLSLERPSVPLGDSRHFFLAPQVEIGKYRVDFLLGRAADCDNLKRCVVIECDGHQWHEKTAEQAQRDKSRDRFLSLEVARVVHFTGREIFRDPGQCTAEAMYALGAANNVDVRGSYR